jgi:hypothetical protein
MAASVTSGVGVSGFHLGLGAGTEGGYRSMRGADLGVEVVNRVRARPEWAHRRCSEWPRGFACSRCGLLQRIWSEPAPADDGRPAWRLEVRTRVLAGFDGQPAQLEALAADMNRVTLAALVRDPEDPTRLGLASTVHVRRGNARWAAELVSFVAGTQAAEARRLLRTSALRGLGAEPDLAADAAPQAPHATEEDPLERVALPVRAPGVWSEADLRASVDFLAEQPGVHAISTPRGLMASFGWAESPARRRRVLLEVDTASVRPGLGRGVSVLLVPAGRSHGVEGALVLNESELLPGCRTDLLGGWSTQEGTLRYGAFFPDAVHRRGLLLEVVRAAARRVEWILPRLEAQGTRS